MQRILTGVCLAACALALSGCIRISGSFPASALQAPTASAAAEVEPVTHGVVGEKLEHGAWTVTVEAAEKTGDKLGGVKPPDGSDFLSVDIGFENKGTEALSVRAEDFKLLDSAGAPMPMAKLKKPAFNASSMRPLLPGFGTSTVFVFSVPKEAAHYTLEFAPRGAASKARLEWQVL